VSLNDLFAPLPSEWIVYRDDALIAINKPAGLSTASSDGADDLITRVARFLATERNQQTAYVGLQEHLERDTSGIALFTLKKEANRGLAKQLESRSVRRDYQLLTAKTPKGRLIRDVAERAGTLRKQLAHERDAVTGDVLLGGSVAHRVMCHVSGLRLRHPVSDAPLSISAPVPPSMRAREEHTTLLHGDAHYRRALLIEAANKRATILSQDNTAVRWIGGAADGMDGIAVDVYGRWLVVHIFDDGWDSSAEKLVAELQALAAVEGVYVKRHPKQKNDLAPSTIAALALEHAAVGTDAPDPLRIIENGVPLFVRLGDGLRTGLFLDQRDNRQRVHEVASGKSVLNLFAYTCGFSSAALAGGATSVTSVDASAQVMSRVQPSLEELSATDRHVAMVGDCFDVLRSLQAEKRLFDLIVIDPPSYASTSSGRFRLRRDYPKLVSDALAVSSAGASLLFCANHHGTTDRELRAFVLQGLEAAGVADAKVRVAPPPLDFQPAPGGHAELKSVWVELDSILRP